MLWLNDFSSWNEFVEFNFFQDYIDENGEVIPFCENHSWEMNCNEISDFDEFFENAWQRIELRTQRMIVALEEKI